MPVFCNRALPCPVTDGGATGRGISSVRKAISVAFSSEFRYNGSEKWAVKSSKAKTDQRQISSIKESATGRWPRLRICVFWGRKNLTTKDAKEHKGSTAEGGSATRVSLGAAKSKPVRLFSGRRKEK
jgi:hypothetical protein